jgi:hypothetical protein
MIKEIMIPVAAFAVTVTGASAFNSDMLSKIDVDLTDSQVSALEEMHELRQDGADRDEINSLLEEAGLDKDTMKEIKGATREVHQAQHEAVESALESDDYDAFQTAIADGPLAEAITSEADFETFKAAHDLRADGDKEGAAELMSELGIEKPEGRGHGEGKGMRGEMDGEMRGEMRGERGGPDAV